MITFIVEDRCEGFRNLFPLNNGHHDLTEPCWLPRWFDLYNIEYNTLETKNATANSWYPIGINYWDFSFDFIGALSNNVKEKLSAGKIKLLFIYREGDSPRRIRDHIKHLAHLHHIDANLIWLISGHSSAGLVENCLFFWYFDCNYFLQTQYSPKLHINSQPRHKNITCLSRVHKNWREWFIYNLWNSTDKQKNFYSYGNVQYTQEDDYQIWNTASSAWMSCNHCISDPQTDPKWLSTLPLVCDNLNFDQHNQHHLIVSKYFQDSYWNIVLETLLETEDHTGIFITEKTLKPIRNGQSFLILGCKGSLSFLRDRGYKTFATVIDESYDEIENIHNRWFVIFELAKWLANMDHKKLDRLQKKSLPIIQHNQQHFQRNRQNDLMKLAANLDTI